GDAADVGPPAVGAGRVPPHPRAVAGARPRTYAPAAMVRLRLLGGFGLEVDDRPADDAGWRLRKARTLVKMLALAPGHRLHREQAIEVLWPGRTAASAANNLHQALHVARRQ